MKKILKFSCLLLVFFLFTGCDSKETYLKEINYSGYQEKIKNKESFILEVMRTDCSACVSFKPKLTEVVNEYKVTVYYINTDHLSEKEYDDIYKDLSFTGTPTVFFFRDGKEETTASRIVGSVSKDKIIQKMKDTDFIK